jgi:uncharacterized protein (TIGR02145 family)
MVTMSKIASTMYAKLYEAKELILFVAFIATCMSISMFMQDGCASKGKLQVKAAVAGEVWINGEKASDGPLAAGAIADYEVKKGACTVTLQRGEELLATRLTRIRGWHDAQVTLGEEPLTDTRDGLTYPTHHVSNLRWMATDLAYAAPGSRCYHDQGSCPDGRLYTWDQAMKACPPGWRLPTMDEWEQLTEPFGGCEKCKTITIETPALAAEYLHEKSDGPLNLRMGGWCELKDAALSCKDRSHIGSSGTGSYWSSSDNTRSGEQRAYALSVSGAGAGSFERVLTKEERRSNPNARPNAKITESYGPSSTLVKVVQPKQDFISARCVAD